MNIYFVSKVKIIALSAVFFVFSNLIFSQTDSLSVSVLKKMIHAIYNLKSIEYVFDSKERISGEFILSKSIIKNTFKPYNVYLKSTKPDGSQGPEVIYKSGENSNQALVAIHQFPYINLNLDPEAWLMKRERHHSIAESGLTYLARHLEYNIVNPEIASKVKLSITETSNTYTIEMYNNDYKLIDYKTQQSETIQKIAQKLFVSQASVLEANPNFSNSEVLPQGTTIKITKAYAKKVLVTINKQSFLPESLQIYDLKGLFAEYNYEYKALNKTYTDLDFSPENPSYGF